MAPASPRGPISYPYTQSIGFNTPPLRRRPLRRKKPLFSGGCCRPRRRLAVAQPLLLLMAREFGAQPDGGNANRTQLLIRERWRDTMLWTIFVILLVLWLLGLIGHVGGALIHLLLVVAAVVLIINLLSGRRTVV
jgi:hypothetical protein